MDVINPKSEIYRIIKRFLINRPGGINKLNYVTVRSACQIEKNNLTSTRRRNASSAEMSGSFLTTY